MNPGMSGLEAWGPQMDQDGDGESQERVEKRERRREESGGRVGGHALLSPSFGPEFMLPW